MRCIYYCPAPSACLYVKLHTVGEKARSFYVCMLLAGCLFGFWWSTKIKTNDLIMYHSFESFAQPQIWKVFCYLSFWNVLLSPLLNFVATTAFKVTLFLLPRLFVCWKNAKGQVLSCSGLGCGAPPPLRSLSKSRWTNYVSNAYTMRFQQCEKYILCNMCMRA